MQGNGHERVEWVDQVKGVGITLVVLGHVYTDAFSAWVYLFHMPLFFMIAGLFCRPGRLGDITARRSASLLLPYAAYLVLLVLVGDLVLLAHGVRPGAVFHAEVERSGRYLFGGQKLAGALGTLWFLPCLFMAITGYAWVRPWVVRHGLPATLAVAALGYALTLRFGREPSPLNLTVAPAAIAFVAAGDDWMRRFGKDGPPPALTVIAALLAARSVWGDLPMDMKHGDLGSPIWTALDALGWSHLVLTAFQRLGGPHLPGGQLLCTVGRASLVILALQRLVIVEAPAAAPPFVIALAALLLPLAVHEMLEHAPPAVRLLLLGERIRRPAVTPAGLRSAGSASP